MTPDSTLLESQPVYGDESPFLADPVIRTGTATSAATKPSRVFGPGREFDSPFVSEYAGETPGPGPEAELFAEVMGELHDGEFEEALEDLVNEAAAVAEQQPSYEAEDPNEQRRDAERAVRGFLAPLQRAAETTLDRMEAALGQKDVAALSESEIDTLFEQLAPIETEMPPTFENFLGGLVKKAKAAIKKVKSVLPHSLILNKLKGLVKPLLERVLKFAINKLPVSVRPMAQQLAKQFLKAGETSQETADEAHEAAAADPAALQQEFDARLAGSLVAGESFEQEAAVQQTIAEEAAPLGDPLRDLERARQAFARHVVRLADGEDPAPAVERFVPAILAALKLGIKVIGRPKVVNFLAGLVAKLIGKYVGQHQAVTLSRSLVDAGLGLLSLEAAEGHEPVAAGYALASTVEDTVNRLVQSAPSAAWEHEDLLEAYAVEAFQRAASAHFPDSLIRAELHETTQASGVWVGLPEKTARKRYKKYSRILEITITPQLAAAVKTFGGIALSDFLKDRMGVKVDRPILARLHLYEAIPGTTLSLIALHEKSVAGLGTGRRGAYSLMHPLTPDTAGLLAGEPGLGRPASPEFLAKRRRIEVGQRVYYLDVPGARVRLAPAGRPGLMRPARSTQTHVRVDLTKREVCVLLFYSEAEAQELLKMLRRKVPAAAMLTALKTRHDAALEQILTGQLASGFRLIHEATPTDEAGGMVGSLLRTVGKPLFNVLMKAVLGGMRKELETRFDRFAGAFEKAAMAEADGVTVAIRFKAPPLLEHLRRLLKPGGLAAAPAVLASLAGPALGDYHVDVQPGFASA